MSKERKKTLYGNKMSDTEWEKMRELEKEAMIKYCNNSQISFSILITNLSLPKQIEWRSLNKKYWGGK
ncbi:hypothetical protein KAR91_81535 [Candidatus Pacearchaeota archaeon]|nr:hypothetical protein [Candidatus Pacearchaeota archaeon]